MKVKGWLQAAAILLPMKGAMVHIWNETGWFWESLSTKWWKQKHFNTPTCIWTPAVLQVAYHFRLSLQFEFMRTEKH